MSFDYWLAYGNLSCILTKTPWNQPDGCSWLHREYFSLDVAILILLCSQLASDNLKGFVCSSGYIFFQIFHLISHWILNNVTWWQWVLQHGSGRCCDYWIGRIYDFKLCLITIQNKRQLTNLMYVKLCSRNYQSSKFAYCYHNRINRKKKKWQHKFIISRHKHKNHGDW